MNNHYNIMVIKKLIETTPKPLNLLRESGLTPFELSTLMPVSRSDFL
jgi:hypothetical protein